MLAGSWISSSVFFPLFLGQVIKGNRSNEVLWLYIRAIWEIQTSTWAQEKKKVQSVMFWVHESGCKYHKFQVYNIQPLWSIVRFAARLLYILSSKLLADHQAILIYPLGSINIKCLQWQEKLERLEKTCASMAALCKLEVEVCCMALNPAKAVQKIYLLKSYSTNCLWSMGFNTVAKQKLRLRIHRVKVAAA